MKVFLGYFTPEVIDEVRGSTFYFKQETWERYRKYHNQYEKIDSKNAVHIMNEFRNACETIAILPKASVTHGNLIRLFCRD